MTAFWKSIRRWREGYFVCCSIWVLPFFKKTKTFKLVTFSLCACPQIGLNIAQICLAKECSENEVSTFPSVPTPSLFASRCKTCHSSGCLSVQHVIGNSWLLSLQCNCESSHIINGFSHSLGSFDIYFSAFNILSQLKSSPITVALFAPLHREVRWDDWDHNCWPRGPCCDLLIDCFTFTLLYFLFCPKFLPLLASLSWWNA